MRIATINTAITCYFHEILQPDTLVVGMLPYRKLFFRKRFLMGLYKGGAGIYGGVYTFYLKNSI
jgi:hypothetical protein